MGDLLNNSPGLCGMQVEFMGFIEAPQDPIGQVADLVGQRHGAVHGCQPASSRRPCIRLASPVRPKIDHDDRRLESLTYAVVPRPAANQTGLGSTATRSTTENPRSDTGPSTSIGMRSSHLKVVESRVMELFRVLRAFRGCRSPHFLARLCASWRGGYDIDGRTLGNFLRGSECGREAGGMER